jgi:hypothetical protein
VPRQPGQVCQIGGIPECSRNSADTYWSYWWRAKGSSRWVYATEGAATHDPAPGATEAWVWQDGGRREPPDIALRTICPQLADPDPTPSPSPETDRTRTASRSPSATPSPSTSSGGGASGRTSERRSPAATRTPRATHTSTPPATPSTATSSPDDLEAATPPTTGVSSQDRADGTDGADGTDDGSVPWVGVAVGGGLIAAFGGAALARSRRGGGP